MDTYSDNNSGPPEYPSQSAGSSVSSRLQDEYEELLKYAVVIPKIDVDDLPRVLADSKRSLTQSHRRPSPDEQLHTSNSGSDDDDLDFLTAKPSQSVKNKQGLGRIISPARQKPNKESDIQTVTAVTRVSPSQSYRHQPRNHDAFDADSDAASASNRNNHAREDSDSDSDGGSRVNRTLQRSYELAPSSSDLSEIEKKLDMWSRQVNSNIMDEISRLKIKLVETSKYHLQTTESRHASELNTLHNELDALKELLHTYEVSIERKDGVVANLTRSLQNQKEKFNTLKTFADWKIQFAAKKQEGYGMRLAAQHHNRCIQRRCWRMWHMIIVEKWRRRVEKACQAKAQEVCISLTNDYETKLQSLDEKYMASREEVMSLHREREHYEENMKKAFMRGVCALNMEAMNMFHEPDPDSVEQQAHTHFNAHSDGENGAPPLVHTDSLQSTTMPQSTSVFSAPSPMKSKSYTVQHGPAYVSKAQPGPFTSTGARSKAATSSRGQKKMSAVVTATGKPGKPSTAKKIGQQKVLIERHDNS